MSVERCIVMCDSVSGEPLYWEDFRNIELEKLDGMPINNTYETPEDLYYDFKNLNGPIILSMNIGDEFLEWFEELLSQY